MCVKPITLSQYRRLVAPRPWLWWDVADIARLSVDSVVESILTRGDWPDFLEALDELGTDQVREVFFRQINRQRNNYRPQTRNLYQVYFERHA
ncbi:hypothetical protein [Desulfonatronum lacustre]|uniref:hypothetical protein n=1 Tax=Desulfonatronum lacustre TaxID=66849 RepID=UPI00146FB999|nr:hypothetical protein [Desulfonatronum lacustre]SMP68075.1 hypothetical protein SAMN06295888_115118 [Desulfonatronum zhilinae]